MKQCRKPYETAGELREYLARATFAAPIDRPHRRDDAMDRPGLVVTTDDARRLDALLQGSTGSASPMAALLEEELARASVVAPGDIAADVVTMHSRVVCRDELSGDQHEIELVYPHEADADRGRVSVLAPVGAALLGLAVGSAIDWPMPGGRRARVRVVAVPYQPEAARRA
jgi:regulator of nucleoside diphosphate kinase